MSGWMAPGSISENLSTGSVPTVSYTPHYSGNITNATGSVMGGFIPLRAGGGAGKAPFEILTVVTLTSAIVDFALVNVWTIGGVGDETGSRWFRHAHRRIGVGWIGARQRL